MTTASSTADPVLIAALTALQGEVRDLRARVALLEAAVPPFAEDGRVRGQLAESTRGLPFTSAQLLAHARVDPALAAALDAVLLTTAAEVGCYLRTHRGIRDGIAIERTKRQWRVRSVDTSCTSPAGLEAQRD